jgi:hypothetical protein
VGAFNRRAAELSLSRKARSKGATERSRKKNERRALIGILCSVTLPLILAFLLVGADMRNNLSELKPLKPAIDGTTLLLGWQELESGAMESALSPSPRWDIRPQVRMLGYMMDGDEPFREGAAVRTFLLLPDAGHILHPAHRDPDQMVKVTLTTPSVFHYRRLVWVSGTFGRTGKPARSVAGDASRHQTGEAMYEITNGAVSFASDAEIVRWFEP